MRAAVAGGAGSGGGGRMLWHVDFPAVLGAVEAKSLAGEALARRWAERDRVTLRLAPGALALRPGARLSVAGLAGWWTLDALTIDGLVVVAELIRRAEAGPLASADPGRPVREEDVAIGRSEVALFDLPDLGESDDGRPALHVAVSAAGRYRPVPVELSANGMPVTTVIAGRRALLGESLGVLGPGQALIVDRINSVEVQMADPAAVLLHADEAALAMGANLAVLGDELLQFGRADAVAPGRYRLSNLLRGRRGSESAMAGHAAGEAFALIDLALQRVTFDTAMRGAAVEAIAGGVADAADPPSAARAANGEALRPPSPCQLSAVLRSDGSIDVAWMPRLRESWAWVDGAAAEPPADARYKVVASRGAASIEREVTAFLCSFSAGELAGLGSGATRIAVSAAGRWAWSRETSVIVAG